MPSPKNIEVAVVGVGLVGAEFVAQLLSYNAKSASSLAKLSLVSLSSSKRTIAFPEPAPPSYDWKAALAASSTPFSVSSLLDTLVDRNPKDKTIIVVDNTASEDIARSYPQFLKAGINVVTPNKKAFSGDLSLSVDIAKSAEAGGSRYYNEATVGAGLPVVGPLRDLVATGDEVTKIEGVFSGTLSYIFNNYSPATPSSNPSTFASIVTIAREKGYTEPHPGDDLSGTDVARKLTILSRLVPSLFDKLDRGYASVATSSLIPEPLQSIDTGDEFVRRLPEFDAEFEKMRKEAEGNGEVIRYVGVIDVAAGKIEAKLERYSSTHPFAASLSGADNIVLFHTKRYADRPLIVQGAGAGAAVTAMGVLSDVLRFV
ncbi:aspartate kinase homoserine dehydrogenase [Pterulicium gracile]|uniref:Homoserine dehydrogenase n=1 Tax=Pterulicium gracile TaxID=1884261 RepID=A0A5C3Q6G4_9AGAR|nr:aspartate kinase homoserine dehydrogenase [Pterula gracilis]